MTDTITIVKTEVAAAVVQLTRAEVDEVIAVQRAILAAVQDLAAMAQQQRQNPRWWASTAAVAVYTLIGVLIAAATLLSDRLDALDDDQAIDPPPAATSPVVPGPAAPADDWTPDE